MKRTLLFLAAGALCFVACQPKDAGEKPIEKNEITVADGRFTPEVMWSLGQIGEYAVSPDGKHVVYGVKNVSMEQNKGNVELYLLTNEGDEPTEQRLTKTAASEFSPVEHRLFQ